MVTESREKWESSAAMMGRAKNNNAREVFI